MSLKIAFRNYSIGLSHIIGITFHAVTIECRKWRSLAEQNHYQFWEYGEHRHARSESGFTKFRFQDMTQYPEKSNQWHARLDMTSELSGIPLVGFLRDLRHILEPEFGETGLRSSGIDSGSHATSSYYRF